MDGSVNTAAKGKTHPAIVWAARATSPRDLFSLAAQPPAARWAAENSTMGSQPIFAGLQQAPTIGNPNTALGISPSATTEREGENSFGARFYNPTLGRFLTPDWSATPEAIPYADLENPQSLNLYSYVLNNPASATDPDGHDGPNDCKEQTVCEVKSTPLSLGEPIIIIPQQFLQMLDFRNDARMQAAATAIANAAHTVWSAVTGPRCTMSQPCAGTVLPEGELLEAGDAVAQEVATVLERAATATGNETVTVSSRAAAEKAAREFVGGGSTDLPQAYGNRAGQVIGRRSADGTRIFRDDGDHFNLQNLATGGNLHVKFPGGN